MLARSRRKNSEHGQVIVLAALFFVVILAFGALVIDLGVLRNNRQILVNALDAAALAAGTKLPVDGSSTATPAGQVAAAKTLIDQTVAANYPGLPTSAYTIRYKCLVGVDPSTNLAWVSRDVPAVCDPTHAVGHTPVAADFTGAGQTRYVACDPSLGDKCNVVQVSGSSNTNYSLGPVVGVTSGNSGSVVSTVCNGPCGASPATPVDLVIILDRTASMAGNDTGGNNKITSLQNAAKAVLSVYDPAKQRVALGLTGPGSASATSPYASVLGSCDAGGSASVYGAANDANFFGATAKLSAAMTTTSTTATLASTPLGWNPTTAVPYTIQIGSENMNVTSASGNILTVTRGANGTTKATHAINAAVLDASGWYPSSTSGGYWIPVGLSGTDPTSPLAKPSGAAGTYSTVVGGTRTANASSDIVKAINCIAAKTLGTNLATPIRMAKWYLETYGRPGVTKGILLETDGQPQDGSGYTQTPAFTCQAAIDAATAAKASTTANPKGIAIYTVGYGVTGSCPTTATNKSESAAWAGKTATSLLQSLATSPASPYYFNSPSGSALAGIFQQIATNLAHGASHLVQLCPAPIVTGLSPATFASAATVTISGLNLTGTTAVAIGGVTATFTAPTTDTSITAKAPNAGTSSSAVRVTTACGTN